jgi:uncharacterized protein (TIGR03435 family)
MRSSLPILLALAGFSGWAQPPDFEIASIHASDPGPGASSIGTTRGAFNMRHITLRRCIEWAYNLKLNGPGWLDDAKFDIAARAEDRTANDERIHLMLQSLLAERFGLKVHRERREQQVYTLALAKNGPKFHGVLTSDASIFVPSTSEEPNSFSENETGVMAERVSMADLASKLSQPLGRVVIDKTGLPGRYDLRIDITPYLAATDGKVGQVDVAGILFAGFNDQLGLKLESGREAIDMLIIDSVNKTPTGN